MRGWIRLAARFYPRSWRAEFGEEFRAVLDDVKPSWRVFANVLRGAIEMRMVNGRHWAKVVAAMAVAGAIVGFGVSFRAAPVYVSSATIGVTPVADPLRPASPEALRQRVMQQVEEIQFELLSRASLSAIIDDPRLLLYRRELRNEPLEDVIEGMRRNIRMTGLPPTNGKPASIALSISFSYPDAPAARATVVLLTSKFLALNQSSGRFHNQIYRDFWHDMASVEHLKSVPPAPAPEIADVLSVASLPVRVEPNRFLFLAWGFGTGALLGLLGVFVTRWPRHSKRIAAFAVAGCVAAFGVSLLIPDRYTSTAVMRLAPAILTENPLASPGAPPSSAEFLRRMEPEILSAVSLARVIQTPRLNLYRQERATKSKTEAVEKMRANLRIEPIAADSGFTISFTYPDRFKAQHTVTMMISRFEALNQERQRAEMSQMTPAGRQITERKAGEVLDVVDIASLPIRPVFPNRWMFAAAGFGFGVLLGAITLRFRGPGTSAFREFRVGRKPHGRAEAPPHVALLQLEVDGADYGFRAG